MLTQRLIAQLREASVLMVNANQYVADAADGVELDEERILSMRGVANRLMWMSYALGGIAIGLEAASDVQPQK